MLRIRGNKMARKICVFDGKEFYGLKVRVNGAVVDMSTDYAISMDGEVLSLKSEKILKKQLAKKGHYQIGISFQGTKPTIRIHSAMAYTFLDLESCDDTMTVIHKNGDKTDNRLSNLMLDTIQNVSENTINNTYKGFMCLETKQRFNNLSDIDKWLGIKNHGRTVRQYLQGSRKDVRGYHFIEITN